jgi:serine protease Do
MLRKLSFFILLTTTVSGVVNAQEQGAAPKDTTERKVQRMILETPFGTSFLGVQMRDISKENMTQFNLREVRGVGVEKVSENSPAARAGLQNGDVILKFNGEDATSVRKLTRLISEVAPDHQAALTILRGGSEREIVVTLGKRPLPSFENGAFNLENLPPLAEMPEISRIPLPPNRQLLPLEGADKNNFVFRTGSNRQIGVGIVPLTKQLGEYFGVADGKGLLVSEVRDNSPSAKAGIKAGDVIVEIEGKSVNRSFDLVRAINEKKEGDIALTIIRDKNRQTLRVTPEVLKEGPIPFGEFEKFDGNNQNQFNFRVQPQGAPRQLLIAPPVL